MKDCEIFLTIMNGIQNSLSSVFTLDTNWNKVEVELKMVKRRWREL